MSQIQEEKPQDLSEDKNKNPHSNATQRVIYHVKTWALSTTTHGVQKLANAKKIYSRIFWILFILAALSLCFFVIANNIIQYLQFDVTTKIRIIDQKEVIFPVVSICNINPFITPYAEQFIRDYFSNKYNLTIDKYEDLLKSNISMRELKLAFRWLVYKSNDPIFNISNKRLLGWSANELILDSAFGFVKANSSQFDWFYDYFYGNCFRYNMNQSHKLDLQDNGLELRLFVGPSDEYHDYLFPTYFNGLRLFISDKDSLPTYSEGILLRSGQHANIQLSKTFSTIQSVPYSNCTNVDPNTSILTQEMQRLGLSYTRKDCLFICFQKLTIDLFGCYDLQYPKIFDAQPCSNFSIFQTIKEHDYDLSSCHDLCPIDCKVSSYTTSISYSEFPTKIFYQDFLFNGKLEKYRKYFAANLSYPIMKKSLTSVFIYFDQLQFTHISEQEAMSISVLISNIGGTLGLFAGISLLSLLELVELFIYVLGVLLRALFF